MDEHELHLRRELVILLRAIHYFGWDEIIYTHASVRLNKDAFLINNFDYMFDEVNPSQIHKVTIDKGNEEGQNLAGYTIHNAIYKERSDVNCIIHTHTPETIAVSVDPNGLWPASQTASLLLPFLGYHEYRGVVDTQETVDQMIQDLDKKYAMLLVNHGALTIGDRVAVAFHRMYRLQRACEAQVLMPKNAKHLHPEILDKQFADSKHRNHERPGTDQTWNAIKRLVYRTYGDLK